MKSKSLLLFTKLMSELTAAHIPVRTALSSVVKMKGAPKTVSSGASELLLSLEAGTSFSLALTQCSSIDFPKEYRAFISAAEETGSLEQTFSFLLKREALLQKRRSDAVSLCIYPFVIVILAFLGSIVFMKYGALLVPDVFGTFDYTAYKRNALVGCVKANVFLSLFITAGLCVFKKMVSENVKLDLYRAVYFLSESGIDLYRALVIALPVVRGNAKWECMLITVMESLKQGKNVSSSFVCFGTECELALETAENCSSITEAFKHLVEAGEQREVSVLKQCMNFVEPVVFLGITIYLIILLKSSIMPILFSYGM